MAALEMEPDVAFDPDAFQAFLAAQADFGTQMGPTIRSDRHRLPVTATSKIDKKPLRADQWNTTDPIWFRAGRSDQYVLLTGEDVAQMSQEFTANGRGNLLRN